MNDKLITTNLQAVITKRSVPGLTIWNRLEGRPRADNFERALRVEVRDPLWMLTRQWQMGEFLGDDAGSPIFARVQLETTQLSKYQPVNGAAEEFTDAIPFEARVEQMPIPFTLAHQDVSLDIRLLAGRHWLKLAQALPAAAIPDLIGKYPIHLPELLDINNKIKIDDAAICAHPETWSNFAAVATRRMDGVKLYQDLKAGNHASDGIPALAGSLADVLKLEQRFVPWFEKLFYQPTQPTAWEGDRLEYQFACSCPEAQEEKVFVAEEYYQGHLDWYNFDIDQSRQLLGESVQNPQPPKIETIESLPTQVKFNGMPNTRWWAFEDGRTNFGDVKPDTTDLAKLLLIEFGLVYANDWFLTPYTVPVGSVVNIRGMAVTNVFGERTWIEAAGRGDDDDWQRWAMFLISIKGKGHEAADLSLFIPPVAQKVIEGRPLEEILFARDEMANMVWGIEKTIPSPSGEPKPGSEAAQETRAFFARESESRKGAPPTPPPFAAEAKIRYKVMSSVPEEWIPLIPVHIPNDVRETQLQRAAMLRTYEGDEVTRKVEPRTSLLRQGLEDQPNANPYFLHEEEVPRAGVRVTQSYQRTRWRDGRAWVWLGVRKQTGRGEGSSGLAFDRIIDPTEKP
jgi:hypothetical protein